MHHLIEKKLGGISVVLASRSPRRRELLRAIIPCFRVDSVNTDEAFPPHLKKEEIALYLAREKAQAYAGSHGTPQELVITADTIVWLKNQVVNKPRHDREAKEMLTRLSGNTHEVYTGVCLHFQNRQRLFYARSSVRFRLLLQEEIDYYVEKYQPMDKAGAYGIQEWIGYVGIEHISGSYFNVMGLPTQLLYQHLLEFHLHG